MMTSCRGEDFRITRFCEEILSVTVGFASQKTNYAEPDVAFIVNMNKLLEKQSWRSCGVPVVIPSETT